MTYYNILYSIYRLYFSEPFELFFAFIEEVYSTAVFDMIVVFIFVAIDDSKTRIAVSSLILK